MRDRASRALRKNAVKAGSWIVSSSRLIAAKLSERIDMSGPMESEGVKLDGRPAVESTRPVTSPKTWVMLLTKDRGTADVAKECLILCRRD